MRFAAALLAVAMTAAAADAGSVTQGQRGARTFRLFVPERGDGPLVVALHGCWQTADDFALGTRLDAAAERRGLVVVYPQQSRRDNVYRCWNWFAPDAGRRGETAALLDLVRAVRTERTPAHPRVLVVGFSAGGFMAVNLACADPALVAGVGVTAGGPYRCGVGPDGAIQCMRGQGADSGAAATACLAATGARALDVRASLWHGGADAVVSPLNLAALETMFVRVTGATTGTTGTRDGAVRAVHRNRRGAALVEAWLVRPMGHAWSGGDARGTHTFPAGPDATSRILDFLLGER